MFKLALPCLLVALCLPRAWAAGAYYEGLATAAADGRPLYRESHWLQRDGAGLRRITLFRCVDDGRAFARRIVDEGPGAAAPDFAFEDARDGYREGVRSRAGRRFVYTRPADGEERSRAIEVPPGAAIDAGFDARVRELWPLLAAGRAASVPFLIPSRQAFYRFRAEPRPAQPAGAGELRLRLRLDAWYGFAAPDIELAYDRSTRRLRSFAGISTIRDHAGAYRKVRIVFPATTAAPDMDAAAALRTPLSGRCR